MAFEGAPRSNDTYSLDGYPVVYKNIGKGFEAIENTVKAMIGIIRESAKNVRIRSAAARILVGVPEKDKFAEADAIYQWVRNHTRYTKDIDGTETLQSPLVALDLIEKGFAFQSDCFAGNTEIIVRNKETKLYALKSFLDLQNSWKEYEALSYNFQNKEFEFKDIIGFVHKKNQKTYEVKVLTKRPFECTGTHEFFMNEGQLLKHRKTVKRKLTDIDMTRTCKRQILAAKSIPILNQNALNDDAAFLKGIYAAEGYAETQASKVYIAQNKKEIVLKIRKALTSLGVPFSERRTEKSNGGYFYIKDCPFKEELKKLGGNSFNVRLNDEILSSDKETITRVLGGYIDGDGFIPKKHQACSHKWNAIYNTSSNDLAKHLEFLHLLLGNPLTTYYQKNHMGAGKKPIWRLYDMKRNGVHGRTNEPNLVSHGIKSVKESKAQDVYCITVKDNHNLVLSNGVLASNCDDQSMLLLSLLKSVGAPVALRIAGYKNDGKYTHIYGLVYLYDQWIPADPIKRGVVLGWEEESKKRHKDYKV